MIVGARQRGSEAGAAARKFSHVQALGRDPGYIGLWTQNILDPSLQEQKLQQTKNQQTVFSTMPTPPDVTSCRLSQRGRPLRPPPTGTWSQPIASPGTARPRRGRPARGAEGQAGEAGEEGEGGATEWHPDSQSLFDGKANPKIF